MCGPLLAFVDDNEADHLLIQEALGALEYPVRSQHFVQAGRFLTAFDEGTVTPDAIITDLNMPGPSGFDLLRAIRERPGGMHVPLLVFSTSPTVDDRARAAEQGVAGYFVKPISYEGLVDQLHEMVVLVRHCQAKAHTEVLHPAGPLHAPIA